MHDTTAGRYLSGYLTVAQATARLGISKVNTYRMIHSGRLPATQRRRFGARKPQWYIRVRELDRVLREREAQQQSQTADPLPPPPPPDESAQLYTVPEVAQMLGCHPETIRRHIRTRLLEAFTLGVNKRSHYRIPAPAVEQFRMTVNITTVPADVFAEDF